MTIKQVSFLCIIRHFFHNLQTCMSSKITEGIVECCNNTDSCNKKFVQGEREIIYTIPSFYRHFRKLHIISHIFRAYGECLVSLANICRLSRPLLNSKHWSNVRVGHYLFYKQFAAAWQLTGHRDKGSLYVQFQHVSISDTSSLGATSRSTWL